MKTKLAAVLMFLMLLSASIPFMMHIKPVSAQPPITMRVVPSYVLGGEIGSNFTVDIDLENLHAENRCVAIQFRLTYDETLLMPIGVVEGPFLPAHGTTFFTYWIENVAPWGPNVLVGDIILPPHTTFPSGNGTLATIRFMVMYRPVYPDTACCCLCLEDTLVLDDNNEELPHEVVPGEYCAWPTRTSLTVVPDPILGGVIGSEFTVDVDMEITGDPCIISAQFRLLFDADLIMATSVVTGEFFETFGTTYCISYIEYDPLYGWNVLVGCLILPNGTGHWNPPFPSGSGTIATITFEVLSRPVWPDTAGCELKLRDTQILNCTLDEQDHIVYDGYYEALQIRPPTLSVDPNPVVGGVIGSEFDVNVTMNDLDIDWNCSIIEFTLPYCGNLLEFVSAVEGPFMGTAGPTWFISDNSDWPPYGLHVQTGNMMEPPWTTFPSGTGTVATITFKVLDRPIAPDTMWCLLDLKDTLVLDKEVEEIPHYATGSLYKASQIFPPTLKVEPPLTEMMTAYQLFDINITINDLDADWNCTMIEFKLVYNGTLLEAVDVVEGPFPPLFGNTLFINFTEQFAGESYVLIGILWWDPEPFPHGTGTLATITFNATYQGRDPLVELECDLVLEETSILDEYWNAVVNEIPHYTEDGHYIIYSTHFADVNRDGKVDMRDIGAIALAFGTSPEHPGDPPRWNEAYDVNYDGKIDMKDVAIAARNFGWPYT